MASTLLYRLETLERLTAKCINDLMLSKSGFDDEYKKLFGQQKMYSGFVLDYRRLNWRKHIEAVYYKASKTF